MLYSQTNEILGVAILHMVDAGLWLQALAIFPLNFEAYKWGPENSCMVMSCPWHMITLERSLSAANHIPNSNGP